MFSENANGKNNTKVGNLIIQLANCVQMMLQLVKLMQALAGFYYDNANDAFTTQNGIVCGTLKVMAY